MFELGNWHDEIKAVVQQVQGLNYEKDLSFFDEEWSEAQAVEPPIEWLWTGWLPRRHVSLIVSYAGIGKSFIVLDWLSAGCSIVLCPTGRALIARGYSYLLRRRGFLPEAYAERTGTGRRPGCGPKVKPASTSTGGCTSKSTAWVTRLPSGN
ncbi:MAG: AAA family ATPase [Anaerolineales bacterium]|nr:AAA family ATPase [Anaerolineales bacterium]